MEKQRDDQKEDHVQELSAKLRTSTKRTRLLSRSASTSRETSKSPRSLRSSRSNQSSDDESDSRSHTPQAACAAVHNSLFTTTATKANNPHYVVTSSSPPIHSSLSNEVDNHISVNFGMIKILSIHRFTIKKSIYV